MSPDSLRLHDAVEPALDAGRYRVVSHADTRDGSRPLPTGEQHLEITGPRFRLEPGDVASVQPPRDAVGAYGADLAHVVLRRRTLPWERRGLGSGAPPATPWLALLLLGADEAQLHENVPLEDVVGRARARRFPDRRRRVTAVTVAPGTPLESLLPSAEEIELLAHVREVDVADTALAGADDDGWFAVVVGNRIAVGEEGPGRPYVACLVSLEERDDLRTGTPDTRSLVSLYSWRFTSTSGGGTFRRLVRDAGRAAIGEAEGDDNRVGELGHVALDGTDRSGRPVRAAIRGPLVARPIAEPRPAEVTGPDGAMLLDRSLEVARELGRLLGAADGRFLRAVQEWRRAELIEGERRAGADAVTRAVTAASGGMAAPVPPAMSPSDRAALPALAAHAALQRLLGARLRAADRHGVPAGGRAAARRAREQAAKTEPPPAVEGIAPAGGDDLVSLRRRRRSQIGEA